MMTLISVFQTVLSLTAAGSLGVLLVLGIKRLSGNRFGPRWNYLVWLLPLALYLIPVYLPQGAAPSGGAAAPATPPAAVQAAPPVVQTAPPPGMEMGTGAFPVLLDLWELWQRMLPALALMWLLGLLLTAAVRLADQRRLTRSLGKCSYPPEPEGQAAEIFARLLDELHIPQGRAALRICPGVESPLLMGLWHSTVFLPGEDLPEDRLEMMLRHELHHYLGRDLWLKAAALGAACIHWFNPLVLLLVKDLDRCCELRCDQRTTKKMTPSDRLRYGRMLLDVAQRQSEAEIPVSAGAAALAMNKDELKRRLELLRAGGRTSPWCRALAWALALTVALAGVACSAAANPGPEAPAPESPASNAEDGPETPKEPPSSSQTPEPPPPESIPEPDSQDRGPEETQPLASGSSAQSEPPGSSPALVPDEPAPTPDAEEENSANDLKYNWENYALDPEEAQRLTKDLTWDKALIWPVDGGYLSVGFYDYYGHTGMDIGAGKGTAIYAAADGVVTYAANYSIWPYGKSILIDHGDGVQTRYAHCQEVQVEPGDTVKRGETIGLVGRTGNITGSACHFELRVSGEAQDPSPYTGTTPP